jgi:CBS domain-containing protein
VIEGRVREEPQMSDTVRAILQHKGRHVWSVSPDDSVFEAVRLMAEKGIGALVVLADERLAGIVSERDYARKVILQGRSSGDTRVQEIMTSPVFSVGPDHTVDDCMRIVTAKRIRHLPVVLDDRVIGIVSIGDLVRSVISRQGETIQYLQEYIVGKYPA